MIVFLQFAGTFVLGIITGYLANFLWDRHKKSKFKAIHASFINTDTDTDGYYVYGKILRGTKSAADFLRLQGSIDKETFTTSAPNKVIPSPPF